MADLRNPTFYFVLIKFNGVDPGSVLRGCSGQFVNMENPSIILNIIIITPGCAIISQSKADYILQISRRERLHAFMMIQDDINSYIPISSKNNFTQLNISGKISKCYLISTQYRGWLPGSLFSMVDKNIYECDTRNGGEMNENIPRTWIEITKAQYLILMKEKRVNRLHIYNTTIKIPEVRTADLMFTLQPQPIDFKAKTVFFEISVITPNCVIEVRKGSSETWTIEENVNFPLIESGSRHEGILKWIGLVNGFNSAAVELAPSERSVLLLLCRCSQAMNVRLQISNTASVVLVRLSTLNKSIVKNDTISKYFAKMYGLLNDSSLAAQIFDDASLANDSKFLTSLVLNCPPSFATDLCVKLISVPNDSRQLSQILDLINKIAVSHNDHLLKLAKACLKLKKMELFKFVLGKCGYKNILLDNGETFITDLIMDKYGEETVNQVLKMKLFDINVVNKDSETALTLACDRLFVSTVALSVEQNCTIDHDNFKAMDRAFAATKIASDMDQMTKIVKVIEILNKSSRTEINMCTICMDRKINTVFNCGHNSCQDCAGKLVVCHFCKVIITNRVHLFLS